MLSFIGSQSSRSLSDEGRKKRVIEGRDTAETKKGEAEIPVHLLNPYPRKESADIDYSPGIHLCLSVQQHVLCQTYEYLQFLPLWYLLYPVRYISFYLVEILKASILSSET